MSARPRQCPGTSPLTAFIDVSKWQGPHVDWAKVVADPQKIAMGIARCTVGASIDSTFHVNWRAMKAAGVIRGPYIAFHASRTAAQHFTWLKQALGADYRPGVDAPPALDIEKLEDVVLPVGNGPEDVDALLDRASELVRLIEAEWGVRPWIYAGSFWHFTVAGMRPARAGIFSTLPLWTPHYEVECPGVPKGWDRWTMWQHSSRGRVAGLAGNVDMSWFRGTRDELVKLIGTTKVC